MSLVLKHNPNSRKRLIAEFSNGCLQNGTTLSCELFQHKQTNNLKLKKRKILLADGLHLKYVGNNYETCEEYPYAHKYVIAEVDKRTGIAQLFEADHFKLRPIMVADVERDDEEKEKTKKQSEQDERSFSEKQDDLTEVFGSHKRKRAMVTRLRNKVADSTEAVQTSVEALMETSGFMSPEEDPSDAQTIIPCNKDANVIEDIYPLGKIVPEEVSKALIPEAEQFIRPTLQTIKQWQSKGGALSWRLITEHARNPPLAIVQSPDVHTEYACCLQLMAYLIKTFKLKSSEFRRSRDLFSDMAEPVKNWLLSEFFLGGHGRERKMPQRMKDKVLAVALVVAWNIDSFATDAELFKEAFAISSKKLSLHVRALGGSIKVHTSGGIRKESAVLSLPLQFPKTERGPRGRK
ncbi:DNA-directed RNA polymerase I subunit RPA49-like [Clavelina lepadiformis]|uniref:DNA-directed RNA polymerase I subunit RPA49-like n=1 Tax=Clavelina lepadiformis TaxID=159417 RepID=UPI004043253A